MSDSRETGASGPLFSRAAVMWNAVSGAQAAEVPPLTVLGPASKVRALAGLVPAEGWGETLAHPLLAVGGPLAALSAPCLVRASLRPLPPSPSPPAFSPCACLGPKSPFNKDSRVSPALAWPHRRLAKCIFHGPISKLSHVLRFWGLGRISTPEFGWWRGTQLNP